MSLLAAPIAFVFNPSTRHSVYPSAFKGSLVVPIYKDRGDEGEPGNYRPISLPPFLAKLFECVLLQLQPCLQLRLAVEVSARFLTGTESALMQIKQFVVDSWNRRWHVVADFLDLSKTFDSLDHDILSGVLSSCGVVGSSCDWFSSYLHGRRIRVCAAGLESESSPINFGLPQASVLDPLF